MFELKNNTEKVFQNISHQSVRTYTFANKETVDVHDPIYLHVGSDYDTVIDEDQIVYQIPKTYLMVNYTTKEGSPHVV